MHEIIKAMLGIPWAMEPGALRKMLAELASMTDARLDGVHKALVEKPELLERLQASSGNAAVNRKRRAYKVSEDDLDIRGGVAHIQIAGPMMKQVPSVFNWAGISATSTEAVRAELQVALSSELVSSIQLNIDSPGGTVDGTAALADDLYAARGQKPLNAVASDLIASAAYWVGAQADKLTVGPSASVGSIGVFAVVDDSSKAFEDAGIKVHVVSSGELKGAFAAGSKVTEAQLNDLQRNINTFTSLFKTAVKRGRAMSSEEIDDVATGQVWIGSEAVSLNLADSLTKRAQNTSAGGMAHTAKSVACATTGDLAGSLLNPIESATTAAPAAPKETDMDAKEQELARLREENAALQQQRDQDKAQAAKEKEERADALLDQYADRVAPAARAAVRRTVLACDTYKDAVAYLQELPPIDRPDRTSSPGADADDLTALVANHSGEETLAEWQLARVMGQTTTRLRDMKAIGSAVEKVERSLERTEDGRVMSVPRAIMKDGSVLSRDELRKRLGVKSALLTVAALLFSMFGVVEPASATALSSARLTTCKLSGYTKRYLMKASTTIYSGGLVMVNSAGTVEPAAASASNHGVVGVAQSTVTSAASGSYYMNVSSNVICKYAADTLEQEDVGSVVYADDDQTIDETASSNAPVAGVLIEYVSASVGWVHIHPLFHLIAEIADPLTLSGILSAGGGAGALTFTDTASSIVVPDNDSTALDLGSTGLTNLLRVDTTDNAENITVTGGFKSTPIELTGVTTLDASDCGRTFTVTAAADGDDITLPAATVSGCTITLVYVGADAGAAVDIEPAAGDGIQGVCTLAASVVEFAETDDLGITLTKGTSGTGDFIRLMADGTADWFAVGCAGIWADAAS